MKRHADFGMVIAVKVKERYVACVRVDFLEALKGLGPSHQVSIQGKVNVFSRVDVT
jgi:hypothetical protein